MWFRFMVVVTSVLGAAATAALAAFGEPVTIRVSQVASGSFSGTAFTDELVTLEAHFTTDDYLACESDPACDAQYYLASHGETATVAGIGTLLAANGYAGVHVSASSGTELGEITVGDYTNGLAISVGLRDFNGNILQSFGPVTGSSSGETSNFCDNPSNGCPTLYYGLEGGSGLYFDSVGETATAQILVGSPVPEPGTWVMVGTGLVGAAKAVRRRLVR